MSRAEVTQWLYK